MVIKTDNDGYISFNNTQGNTIIQDQINDQSNINILTTLINNINATMRNFKTGRSFKDWYDVILLLCITNINDKFNLLKPIILEIFEYLEYVDKVCKIFSIDNNTKVRTKIEFVNNQNYNYSQIKTDLNNIIQSNNNINFINSQTITKYINDCTQIIKDSLTIIHNYLFYLNEIMTIEMTKNQQKTIEKYDVTKVFTAINSNNDPQIQGILIKSDIKTLLEYINLNFYYITLIIIEIYNYLKKVSKSLTIIETKNQQQTNIIFEKQGSIIVDNLDLTNNQNAMRFINYNQLNTDILNQLNIYLVPTKY